MLMNKTKSFLVLALACSSFLAYGMFNAGIGPTLGELADQTSSDVAAVGAVLTFLFLGSLIAQIFVGPLTDRFGQNLIFTISLLLLAAGVVGFTTARSLPFMFVLVLIAGLGQGGVDLGANLLVADAFLQNNTSYLNLLHFFFGLGAFIGPALVGVSLRSVGSGRIVHWVAAGIFVLLAAFTVLLGRTPHKKTDLSSERTATAQGMQVYFSPLLWVMGGLILVYVGLEYGLGTWTTRYMDITTGMSGLYGSLVASAYWGALTLGRLAGSAVSRKMSRMQLLSVALLSAWMGIIGLSLSMERTTLTILFLVWIGFSFGTVYPTGVALVAAAFPRSQGKAVGVLAAMGSIGGLILPWLEGILLEKVSPTAFTLFFVGFGIVILLLLLGAYRLRQSQAAGEVQVAE